MNYYYITKLAIIVNDEEIKIGSSCYNTSKHRIEYHSGLTNEPQLKIISGIPELPSINHSKLSPEEQNRLGWIDVEDLFNEFDTINKRLGGHPRTHKDYFKAGLTHQLSIKRYTEEDMLEAVGVGLALSTMTNEPFTSKVFKSLKMSLFERFIQSRNQPELIPIEIEISNNKITITKIL